jgi:hypothetical protein
LRPQSRCLGLVQLKHEVRREALDVPFDLLDQAFRLHAVQVREIFIEHHLPTTKMRFSIAGAAISSSEAVLSVTRTIRPAWQTGRMLLSAKRA